MLRGRARGARGVFTFEGAATNTEHRQHEINVDGGKVAVRALIALRGCEHNLAVTERTTHRASVSYVHSRQSCASNVDVRLLRRRHDVRAVTSSHYCALSDEKDWRAMRRGLLHIAG